MNLFIVDSSLFIQLEPYVRENLDSSLYTVILCSFLLSKVQLNKCRTTLNYLNYIKSRKKITLKINLQLKAL